ncbi:putative amid-like NADH oxidoreductase [Pyrenochaeta sp. MPI-SDFR-AT-0127]|nr:putative amid-like NADH oxidoreductase [Pyrenochaeta sp. MPI-SDFR-AT-0127]
MTPDSIKIYTNFSSLALSSSAQVISQQLRALYHRHSYRASPDARNVVVLGGSFAGLQLAIRLSQSVPSGYRVVLVEKNSHFNYTFNFPRYSVVGGDNREKKAFVPYTNAFARSPEGSWSLVRGKADRIADGEVLLQSGQSLPFEYLAIATGVMHPLPAKVVSPDRDEACAELRGLRTRIQRAGRVAVVGGGAVGVQLSSDIKSAYPDKEVVLVHSRERLLNGFGERLSQFVKTKLEDMSVRVMLQERPQIAAWAVDGAGVKDGNVQDNGNLVFEGGRTEDFDLIIPCTGAIPNSKILSSYLPNSISSRTGRIIVRPTLQLADNAHPNIFALGDIAEIDAPKMARAAMTQADIVSANIVAMIKGAKVQDYEPTTIEGFLKLSLGLEDNVMYVRDGKGGDIMVPGKTKNVDLEVGQAWWYLNASMKAGDA